MDGLARASGAGVWVKDRAGRDHYLYPNVLKIKGELEQEILKRRINPVEAVMPDVLRLRAKTDDNGDPDIAARQIADELLDKAYQDLKRTKTLRLVSRDEAKAWIQTDEGFEWLMWRQLNEGAKEKNLPPLTMDEVRDLIKFDQEQAAARQEEARLKHLSDQASAEDLASFSNGQAGEQASNSLAPEKKDAAAGPEPAREATAAVAVATP